MLHVCVVGTVHPERQCRYTGGYPIFLKRHWRKQTFVTYHTSKLFVLDPFRAGGQNNNGYDAYADSCTALVEVLSPFVVGGGSQSSIIDVGCGHGLLVEAWRAKGGVQSHGLGSSSQAHQAMWPGKFMDFYTIGNFEPSLVHLKIKPTDFVTSFEIAQHLQAAAADTFVSALTAHDPQLVFFGAATPNQDQGLNPLHVNENTFEYWIARFAAHGYRLDWSKTLHVRHELCFKHGKSMMTTWWYPKNILVFARAEKLIQIDRDLLASYKTVDLAVPFGDAADAAAAGGAAAAVNFASVWRRDWTLFGELFSEAVTDAKNRRETMCSHNPSSTASSVSSLLYMSRVDDEGGYQCEESDDDDDDDVDVNVNVDDDGDRQMTDSRASFPPAYVIVMTKDSGRLTHVDGIKKKHPLLNLTTWPAITPDNLHEQRFKPYLTAKTLQSVRRGAIACTLSHLTLIEHFLKTENEEMLVIEDDAFLPDDFETKFALFREHVPKDNEFSQLLHHKGMEGLRGQSQYKHADPLVLKSYAPWGTVGYLISRSGARQFLRTAKPVWYPIDEMFRSAILKKELVSYMPSDDLILMPYAFRSNIWTTPVDKNPLADVEIDDGARASVYWCGHALPVFAASLLGQPARKWEHCRSRRADTLVFGTHGPCKCDPSSFRGVVISVNGEDRVSANAPAKRQVNVGPGGFFLPYGAIVWVEQNMSQYSGNATRMAVAYANSNCAPHRERMAAELAAKVPVYALGTCTGMGKAIRAREPGGWASNAIRLRGYAFVLAAEHGTTPGYVTEKPFVASAAGAIPIYSGDSTLATRYINKDRMLIWNSTTVATVESLLAGGVEHIRGLPAINISYIRSQMRALLEMVEAAHRRNS